MQNEERINGLETQVRTLKRIVYGFGCLLVAGIVVGATSLQTVPDVIKAKKFEVVNGDGVVTVELGTTEDGGLLSINNKDGNKVAATLGAGPNGGLFGLSNKDGQLVASLNANEYGGMLRILNKDGETVAGLNTDEDGDGVLRILNKDGKTVAGLGSDEVLGGGLFCIYNKEEEKVVYLGAGSVGGVVATTNGKGQTLVRLGATTDGNGSVTTENGKGALTSITP